jgi:hypothetical protein
MRSSRLVGLALVWGCFGTGLLLACGGDDSSSSGGTPDASTSSSGGSSGSNTDGSVDPSAPTIVAQNLTIYTGMIAALDGSGTQAQTFAWTVKTVPPGSTVTGTSLSGANTARPSFRADVSGDYVLELTAANGTLSSKKDVTVKAVPAPLFYMQSNFSEKPAYFEYRTIGTDGTGGHPIACRTNGDADGGDTAGLLLQSLLLADMGEDWWEAPSAADPSRVAFVAFDYVDAGADAKPALNARLALGTNANTCQNPPVKIAGTLPDAGNDQGGVNLIQPRFNHAGTRVAYLEDKGGWFVVTVSYDGKDRREVAKMCEGPEDSCSGNQVIFPTRPQWLNDTTVGWARQQNPDSGTGWEVVTATDSANPSPTVYMTCDGETPKSIAFLKDGSVIANRMRPDGGSREDLEVLKPNAGTKKCEVVRNLTNLPLNYSYARDFSISPDESEVAYVRYIQDGGTLPEGGGSRIGGEVYVAAINGASAPAPAGGTPQATQFGPRYVAGATALAFNGVIDGGGGAAEDASDGVLRGTPVIAVLPRDGGGVTYAAKSDIDGGTYVSGGGNGGACDFRLNLCSMGPIQAGGGPTIGITLAGLAWLVGRRRNRKRG